MSLLAGTALAEADFVPAEDLIPVDRPILKELSAEQPHIDLEATGKRFDVVCTINRMGKLEDCEAFADEYPDKVFVTDVLKLLQTWQYKTHSKSGENVIGKKTRLRFGYDLE